MATLEFDDWNGHHLVELSSAQNVIGRGPDCSVRVANSTIGRAHASLNLEAGRWVLNDLNSASGVWIDRALVRGPRALVGGETFQLGNVRFVFRLA